MMQIGETANRHDRAAVPVPDEVERGLPERVGKRFVEVEGSLAAAPE